MNPPSDRDTVLARYREGPALLERALAGLQEADLDAPPSSGGWTIRQIVHHLVDGDDIWKVGLKAALGEEGGEFTLAWYSSLSQEEWAVRWGYADRPVDSSIALLKAIRVHVSELMEHVPDAWNRTIGVRGPDWEVETVSAGFILGMQADHIDHHVARILAIREELGGGSGESKR